MKQIRYLLLSLFLAVSVHAQEIRLLFAGDAMQHQTQIDNALRNGEYDYSSYFQHIKNEITQADLAIVNMEGPLGGKPHKGYPLFSIPDEFAVALKDAGFDVFLTANNHAVDCYSRGINRTIDVLDSLEVYHTGTFKNALEREQNYPLIIEKKGIRMAFLNYTYNTNGIEPAAPCIVNIIDTALIGDDILKAKQKNPDIIIAAMHWGEEYKLTPSKSQERLAHYLINQGVDLIIGSHPHVVQPSEISTDSVGKNHLIVYSLGNFVSNMSAVNTDGGQMILVTLKKTWGNTQIESCGYLLSYTQQKKVKNKIDFTLIPISLAEDPHAMSSMSPNANEITLDSLSYEKMMRFVNNARNIFQLYNNGVEEYAFTYDRR
jgi:poly-gamma-glutamate synthesis protein (capsule biosynthesis protein)